MSNSNTVIAIGCFMALLAVAVGAFGAHGLKDVLDAYRTGIYQTGVQYHMLHAIGLILTGILMQGAAGRRLVLAAVLMLAGIVLFSGSLYALSISGVRWLGMVTPAGGLCFLLAWLVLGYEFMTR